MFIQIFNLDWFWNLFVGATDNAGMSPTTTQATKVGYVTWT
jgi:hypothetical protein